MPKPKRLDIGSDAVSPPSIVCTVLVDALRRMLAGTRLARATAGTLRL